MGINVRYMCIVIIFRNQIDGRRRAARRGRGDRGRDDYVSGVVAQTGDRDGAVA